MVSQLFLGVRLECARCHHHPSEKWGQDDFYSFAAYFARIGRKGRGLSPPISGSEEMIMVSKKGAVQHPLTKETMSPRPLFGATTSLSSTEDWRSALADWVTADQTDYFAKVQVNRVWADLMGRGLVEPVDDLRATNPATNEPLLNALADDFRRQNYDLKQLIYTIATSHVYGLSSLPTERNVADTKNHSRHYRRRLRAEVLHDAICDITLVPTSFTAMPADSRANQIWSHRVGSLFLDTFGRPDANQDPPCERTPDGAVTQALHLMNSPDLHAKVTSKHGRAAQLAASELTDGELVQQIYLLVYGRFPDADEQKLGRTLLAAASSNRTEPTEDLMWALINTPEFLFVD